MTDGVVIGFSLIMGILSMISFVVSLICIAVIVGFKNSTHQVQYVPLKDSFQGDDYEEGEIDDSGIEKKSPKEEMEAEKRLKARLDKWKEFMGTKQDEYENIEEKA